MLIGTSHFVSLMDAIRYYRPYGFDASDVERKIADGEIHIGPPETGKGRLLTIDCGMRYAIAYE